MTRSGGLAAALAGLSLVSACASLPDQPPPVLEEASCNAAAAIDFVGSPASQESAAEAMRVTGARSFRWIPFDSAVTMDYRPDRLNVELDQNNIMRTFRCG